MCCAALPIDGWSYYIQAYIINDTTGCTDRYLSYRKRDDSTRVYLGSSSAEWPRTWTAEWLGERDFKFYTDKRSEEDGAKLSYSTKCSSTDVKVENKSWRKWRLLEVDEDEGLYRVIAINKKEKCGKPYLGRLAPEAVAKGTKCSKNKELNLMKIERSTQTILWRFTPVAGQAPKAPDTPPPESAQPCIPQEEEKEDRSSGRGTLDCSVQLKRVVSGRRLTMSSLAPCGFNSNATTSNDCCSLCKNNDKCSSWMFTKPLNCRSQGIGDDMSVCYLMSDFTGSYDILPDEDDLVTLSGSYYF